MNTYTNLRNDIAQASRVIAPLWPLTHFVAVNPFLGYADRPFSETALHLKRARGSYPLPSLDYFLSLYREGIVTDEDLGYAIENADAACQAAFEKWRIRPNPSMLIAFSQENGSEPEAEYRIRAFSAYLDQREETRWNHLVRQEAAKWCGAHFDKGQSNWRTPWHEKDFYHAWLKGIQYDRTLQLNGIENAKRIAKGLPDTPIAAIEQALALLEIPAERVADILEQTLLELPGWSGYLRYLDREAELRGAESDYVLQLLAVLISYEAFLYQNFKDDQNRILGWKRTLVEDMDDTGESTLPKDLIIRLLWQSAVEAATAGKLREAIKPGSQSSDARPGVQGIFCIDVRSERYRRALESVMPEAQTIGFAGFFGMPVEHHLPGKPATRALCPALLAPPVKSAVTVEDLCSRDWIAIDQAAFSQTDRRRAWRSFRDSAASCFSFVETLGLSYAQKLWKAAFPTRRLREDAAHPPIPSFLNELPLEKKLDLAEGFLRGSNLLKRIAPLVIVCGHGSASANNPYASSLDCGACGGRSGDVNARLAANLLNDSSVREGLAARGLHVPSDTWFIAGIHNTTTDTIRLFEKENVPQEHQTLLQKAEQAFAEAGDLCLLERAASLDSSPGADRFDLIRGRSSDWSQVRPEWGLAGNHAFIVAPRHWTRHADFDGKAFLHEYEPSAHESLSVLENILGGPLVVGSWINLQYFASAANNEAYGSGHKTIHNVVGGLGVAMGNDYDLKTGLPWQSVHDGRSLVHRPCRLHACIAAEPEELDAVLEGQAHLRDLVMNNWIILIALGRDGRRWTRKEADNSWSEQASPLPMEAAITA